MSDNNGTGNPSKPSINITCPRCGRAFTALLPVLEMVNNLRVSLVTAAHERLTKCENSKCRQSFVLAIDTCQVNWGAIAVDDAVVEQMEGTRLVTPESRIIH